jgi:hypothetical protein
MKKTKKQVKLKKSKKIRACDFVRIWCRSSDLLKMLMDKREDEKALYFEVVAW